jgi:hypothetical protein
MFVIYDIAEFLESKGIKTEKFTTQKPDLTFEINNKKFAIEVETGSIYDYKKKLLIERIKSLNQNYDDWFFVVINRNYVKKYRKLGKTIDPRCLKNFLIKIAKNTEICHAKKAGDKKVYRRENESKKAKLSPELMHSCIKVTKLERK